MAEQQLVAVGKAAPEHLRPDGIRLDTAAPVRLSKYQRECHKRIQEVLDRNRAHYADAIENGNIATVGEHHPALTLVDVLGSSCGALSVLSSEVKL